MGLSICARLWNLSRDLVRFEVPDLVSVKGDVVEIVAGELCELCLHVSNALDCFGQLLLLAKYDWLVLLGIERVYDSFIRIFLSHFTYVFS